MDNNKRNVAASRFLISLMTTRKLLYLSGLRIQSRSESEVLGRSQSRNILSDSNSSCPISLHINDANRATYAAASASGVQCNNLFKRTLPRIERHSVRLIESLHFNL